MPAFPKDPDALLDYVVDWTDWLPTGDYIVSAAASVPSGITLNTQSYSSTQHTIWLVSGNTDTEYTIISRIWTNGGRRDDRSFTIRVRER